MSRSLPIWIGRTDDSKPPPRVRLRVFVREGGICYLSKRPISPGEEWECHHRVALINGGRNAEDNLVPVLVGPHRAQTKADMKEKSKTAEIAKSHLGIKPVSTRKIQGRKFQQSERTAKREPKPSLPPRALYR
jgi:5-methylcytosine-specific restriction protein A